jgi:hypothetical protein
LDVDRAPQLKAIVMRHLSIRNSKIVNLNKSSFVVALSVSLLACGHQANVQTASRNATQHSRESKIQTPPTPSPVISRTPEHEVSFGKGLKIVPRTVELRNESRRYQIDIVYPQIEGSKSRGILNLNRRIKGLVTKQYQWPLIPPTKEDLRHYEKWPGVFNSVDLDYDVVLATDELLSIYFEVYSYGIGAAHSVQQSFTVNFDLSSETPIQLAGLFKPDAKHLQFISDYCVRELSKEHQYAMSDPVFKDELAPKLKNYESWNITKEGLRFNFDACKIDGCAAGKVEVKIASDALKEKMKPKSAMNSIGRSA